MGNDLALQTLFLEKLCTAQIPVSVYLINGIKLQGEISSYDTSVILLKNSFSQIIYKHAVSTIVPSKDVPITRLQKAEELA